ncbi:MAG TPA: hypothetical protein VHS31_16350 [Tepidisphaeraceae bacterium]|jgi:probable HAF family extracellular repeat protein|nr:hypothetical protein [Tepidisphaeraceae bacterium]
MRGLRNRTGTFCAIETLETRRLFAFTYTVIDEGQATLTGTSYNQVGVTRVNDTFLSGTHNERIGGFPHFRGYYISPKNKTIDLSPLAGYGSSISTDMSETGVAVGYSNESASGQDEATKWVNGAAIDLGPGEGKAISSDGAFVVGDVPFRASPTNLTTHAAIYGGKKPIDLGVLPGADPQGSTSRAYGVNTSGVVVGDSFSAVGISPFYYDPAKKKIVMIGTPQQGQGDAYAINDAGVVVGLLKNQPFSFDVNTKKLFTYSGATGVGTVSTAFALDINNAGEFVGVTASNTGNHATIWENGVAIDLNTLIPAGSGIQLQYAKSINDKGQILAIGSSAKSFGETFLLSPNRATLSSKGTLTIQGSVAADSVTAVVKGNKVKVAINGVGLSFVKSHVKRLTISLLGGNDVLTLGVGLPAANISAGAGKDVLFIRDGAKDVVNGGAGTDKAQVDGGDVLSLVEQVIP